MWKVKFEKVVFVLFFFFSQIAVVQMSSPQVFLLSAPSGAGKSTALKAFISKQRGMGRKVAGIVQIVKNDRRYLQFLSTDAVKMLQLNDVSLSHPMHLNQ